MLSKMITVTLVAQAGRLCSLLEGGGFYRQVWGCPQRATLLNPPPPGEQLMFSDTVMRLQAHEKIVKLL